MAIDITRRLDPERFESFLCASRTSPRGEDPEVASLAGELERSGVQVMLLGRRRRSAIGDWGPLLRWLRRLRIDILHAHKFGSNVWGTILGGLAGVPVIVAHEHTWSFTGQPLRRLLDRQLIARGADAILAVSEADRRRMVELERIPPSRVIVVPNGIGASRPTPGRNVRAELRISAGTPIFGIVAGLRPQKAVDDFLRAMAVVLRHAPHAHALVVGDGPERASLEALIAKLGIGDHVHVLGLRADVPDLLCVIDVAVLSSRFEGSPLAVLEYMEAGRPIVATEVGGLPDLIEDRMTGLLVPPGDPERLASAMLELLAEPGWASDMGRRGRERRGREFDINVTVRRIEDVYRTLWERS